MKNIFISFLFLALNFGAFSLASFVEWGSLQKTNSLLIDMIPKGDAAFFTLRISGGGIFSSYRMEQYDNLQLIKNVRIKTNTASGMGNLECLTFFGGKLRMFAVFPTPYAFLDFLVNRIKAKGFTNSPDQWTATYIAKWWSPVEKAQYTKGSKVYNEKLNTFKDAAFRYNQA